MTAKEYFDNGNYEITIENQSRGYAKQELFNYYEVIIDYNKAIALNPDHIIHPDIEMVYTNRGIVKYYLFNI